MKLYPHSHLLCSQSPSTSPSSWWEASSSPSSWSALWSPSTAAPACGPSSRLSSPFASPCAAARARPSPWSSPRLPRASAPRRVSPARPPPAPARPEAAAPCGGFLSEVRGSSTAVWCLPPCPRRPPPPRRPLRLCLHPHLPPTRPHPCQEACSTRCPPPTPNCSSTSPPCPLTPHRALRSSSPSSTSSPCSPTPSQQPKASLTSDRADRPQREEYKIFRWRHGRTLLLVFGWRPAEGAQRATGRGIKPDKTCLRCFQLCNRAQFSRCVKGCDGSESCALWCHVNRTLWRTSYFFNPSYLWQ